ncbi:MAG: hypothetical protein ACC656_07370, partial [Candidatus Heimdallarchaeota archaeon]
MSSQNIISLVLIAILIALLSLRIKTVKQNDQRIDKSSLIIIFVTLFSIAMTRFKPTYIDVIAILIIWSMVAFVAIIYSTITDFKVRPKPKMELVQSENPDYIISSPIVAEQGLYPQSSVRSVDISNIGEYTVTDQPVNIIQPTEYQIPIPKLSGKAIIIQVLLPDKMELFLLFLALSINWLIMSPIIGLSVFHPFMLIYWGIISFIFFTIRWSYTSPFQYAARLKLIEKELM